MPTWRGTLSVPVSPPKHVMHFWLDDLELLIPGLPSNYSFPSLFYTTSAPLKKLTHACLLTMGDQNYPSSLPSFFSLLPQRAPSVWRKSEASFHWRASVLFSKLTHPRRGNQALWTQSSSSFLYNAQKVRPHCPGLLRVFLEDMSFLLHPPFFLFPSLYPLSFSPMSPFAILIPLLSPFFPGNIFLPTKIIWLQALRFF